MGQKFEGRNLDEAIGAAASALGVERYQLEYHVVVEKRGFLGGTKRVVIDAVVDEGKQPESNESRDAAMLARSEFDAGIAAMGDEAPSSRRGEERSGRGGRSHGRGRGGRPGDRGGRDSQRGGERPARRPQERRRSAEPAEPAPDQGTQSEQAAAVAEWCRRVIDLGGFELEVRTQDGADRRVSVMFYGADLDLLTERGGSLLDSLQVLATKSFGEKFPDLELEFDALGFKERRAQELEAKARAFGDAVRSGGGEKVFPPMGPAERRIVHMTLADDADVETESRGDGFLKRVVVRRRRQGGSSEAEG